jgi:hypothetical protein
MKKTIQTLVRKIGSAEDGTLKGGFGVIRGGNQLVASTNSTDCTNGPKATCSGTNSGTCTNSGNCSGASNTSTSCTNSGTCLV